MKSAPNGSEWAATGQDGGAAAIAPVVAPSGVAGAASAAVTSGPARASDTWLGRSVRALAFASLDVLAPRFCVGCGEAARGRSAEAFCDACAPGAPVCWEANCIPASAVGFYRGPLEAAVHALKYGKRPDLARPLGDLLHDPWTELALEADALVPVPLHPRRLRERGYNQAALLAARLASATGTPARLRALRRIRETRPLPGLDRAERAAQLAGAIVARRPLTDARIILVDDVVTSGSTVDVCVQALEDAGACVVAVVALARADSKSGS